ncbi:fam-a protein, fragment [Plasmodium vinckei petteri]|uniref:Fam-a protein n=1 Tax=Plasmodium vinckei petteri TaxID=138298 RepID=A0A6V7SK33_PLAVN|nr:fam-a protein, fragment [Plasmodium vinckei petteri]
MNKFYIQIVFFLLSIFICVNNITLATVPTPKEQNNKTLPTGVSQREQIDKLYDIGLTPGEESIKLFDAVLPPEELNKRNREYALSLKDHIRINEKIGKSYASIYGLKFKRKTEP